MAVKTAIQLRKARAKEIVARNGVQSNGKVGHFLVHSHTGEGNYDVTAHVDPQTQQVMRTHCQCPDWARMDSAMDWWIEETGQSPHPGISHVDYCPACKHVLAALIHQGAMGNDSE